MPNLYTWASANYLINTKRWPPGGVGTYLNVNIPGTPQYNGNPKKIGVTGIALSQQGAPSSGCCRAPGSASNTHADFRGYGDFRKGSRRGWWLHLDYNGDGKDDIKKRGSAKKWLRENHPNGNALIKFFETWYRGYGLQPPDFEFPRMSNAVPNWNQMMGREPFGPKNTS